MSKQSSIEFLQECLSIHLTHEQHMQFDGLFQQAKAMHKDEIENAVNFGTTQWGGWEALSGEDYYNKTFNTKEK